MVKLNLGKLFRRKSDGQKTEPEISSSTPDSMERGPMPYSDSPEALRYPGVKSDVREEKKREAPAEDSAKEKKDEEDLPRCPKCDWAMGYKDEECSNCGHRLY